MQIKFADGTIFESRTPVGERQYVRNVYRDTITFVFDPKEKTTDELLNVFTDREKTKLMILSNPDKEGEEYTYTGYSLFHRLIIEDEVTVRETDKEPEKSESLIKVTMAQKTYIEELADVQQGEIDALNEVVADIIGGVYE